MATNRQGYLLRLLKLGVLPYGLFFRERRPGLVILIYHRVGGGTDSDIDLPARLFARQMAHLSAHHTIVANDAGGERLQAALERVPDPVTRPQPQPDSPSGITVGKIR